MYLYRIIKVFSKGKQALKKMHIYIYITIFIFDAFELK